jgi:hypothetical protein
VVSESSVYHCLSSCPDYAHGELPCTVFNCPFPVISPALAVLATNAIQPNDGGQSQDEPHRSPPL